MTHFICLTWFLVCRYGFIWVHRNVEARGDFHCPFSSSPVWPPVICPTRPPQCGCWRLNSGTSSCLLGMFSTDSFVFQAPLARFWCNYWKNHFPSCAFSFWYLLVCIRFYIHLLCVNACVWMTCTCYGIHVKVRGQLAGVRSLLLRRGLQRTKCQAWHHVASH